MAYQKVQPHVRAKRKVAAVCGDGVGCGSGNEKHNSTSQMWISEMCKLCTWSLKGLCHRGPGTQVVSPTEMETEEKKV